MQPVIFQSFSTVVAVNTLPIWLFPLFLSNICSGSKHAMSKELCPTRMLTDGCVNLVMLLCRYLILSVLCISASTSRPIQAPLRGPHPIKIITLSHNCSQQPHKRIPESADPRTKETPEAVGKEGSFFYPLPKERTKAYSWGTCCWDRGFHCCPAIMSFEELQTGKIQKSQRIWWQFISI